MRRFFSIVLLIAAIPASIDAAPPQQAQGAESPEYHFLLARRLERAGKAAEAVDTLKRAIAAAPDSAELRAELAGLYAREDQAADALSTAEEALKRDPANLEANLIIGSIMAALSEQKKPIRPGDDPATYAERAIVALEKARGVPGSDLNTEFTLGRLYLRAGRHEMAIAALRHLVEQQPQYADGGMMLAAAQEAAGRVDDAIATLEATIQQNPSFLRGHMQLIELYEQRRRWKEAAAAYAVAQERNPKADLLRGRALALINANAPKEAQALLQAGIAKTPEPDAALLYLLAESQRKVKDFSGALATTAKLRAAHPDRAVFVYQRAQVLEESGQAGEAEKELRQLLAQDPLDAVALNSLGYMLADRGERLPEAIELLQRALKVEPGNPSYLDSLGWAFFKQGRLELADPPLTEAAGKMPDNSVIQDHLGDLRFKQQRLSEAVLAWERALAGDGDSLDRAAVERKLQDARARMQKK